MARFVSVATAPVSLDLSERGLLRVHADSADAAIAWLGLNRWEDVVLSPDQVTAVLDMAPRGALTGWVDLCAAGLTLRVPYRQEQAPHMRELLRLMCEMGYPACSRLGQREPEPVPG